VLKHVFCLLKQNNGRIKYLEKKLYDEKLPLVPQLFAAAGREHIEKYGSTSTHTAEISVKNYKHGSNNPYAQFQKIYSLKEIMDSPSICYPLSKLQCCPTSDGAAAVLVCNEEFVKKHKLEDQAVEVFIMCFRV